jgi:predicted nucleotidyltransferase
MDQLLAANRDAILNLASQHGAQDVRIFGSFARGQAKLDSDLDLLIKLETGRTLLDLVALKQDLEDLLQRDVDVLTESGISPYIREQVLAEAIDL